VSAIESQASIILDRDPLLETLESANLFRFKTEEEWLEFRTGFRIGGSESAVLFNQGYSGSSTYKMWAEKLGMIPRENFELKFLRIGKLMEPLLRRLFLEETGFPCYEIGDNCIHQSKSHPFMVASLDGIVVTDDGVGVVELKNIHYINRDEWKDGCGPLKYQIQVQHQLMVTGLQFGYLFGLVGGQEPFAHRIDRNDAFIEKALLPACEAFIECLERRSAPQIDGSEATAKALKLLHPDDDGSEVMLDSRFVDFDARLEDLKEQEKSLNAERRVIENELKGAIGSATFGVCPNGIKYSLKTSSRDGYFVEPTKYRVLRRHKAK
jgi:putative phage-type endonuclease